MAVNYLAILVAPFILDGIDSLVHVNNHSFAFMFNGIVSLILAVVTLLFYRSSRVLGLDD